MRDWHDSPQLHDIFGEQATRLLYGPLGFLDPPTVEIEGGLPEDVVSLASAYLVGQTGTRDLVTQIEKSRLLRLAQQTSNPET